MQANLRNGAFKACRDQSAAKTFAEAERGEERDVRLLPDTRDVHPEPISGSALHLFIHGSPLPPSLHPRRRTDAMSSKYTLLKFPSTFPLSFTLHTFPCSSLLPFSRLPNYSASSVTFAASSANASPKADASAFSTASDLAHARQSARSGRLR